MLIPFLSEEARDMASRYLESRGIFTKERASSAILSRIHHLEISDDVAEAARELLIDAGLLKARAA